MKKDRCSMTINDVVQTLEWRRYGGLVVRWSRTERCRKVGENWGRFLAEAHRSYCDTFDLHPPSELSILSRADWEKVPFLSAQPYGNPVCPDNLVVAGCGAPDSWKDWARTMLGQGKKADVQGLLRFFELSSVDEVIHRYFNDELFKGWLAHELAHHFSNRLLMAVPRWKLALLSLREGGPSRLMKRLMWIGEFIPQYCMLSFLKVHHPQMADMHSVFLRTCFEAARKTVRRPMLRDWGFHYRKLVDTHPETVLWYQAKCFVISEIVYHEQGQDFLARFVNEYPNRPRAAIKHVTRTVEQIETKLQDQELKPSFWASLDLDELDAQTHCLRP